jgi:hypothetical protein
MVIDRPNPITILAALQAAARSDDAELAEERRAIREFGGG